MKFKEWLLKESFSIIAYHGTRANDNFNQFLVQGDDNKWGPGVYFTPEQEEAAEWGGRVIQAKLLFQKPYRSDQFMTPELFDQINQAAIQLGKKPMPEDFRNDKQGYKLYQLLTRTNNYSKKDTNQILVTAGFDGIIDGQSEFVALKPETIKII